MPPRPASAEQAVQARIDRFGEESRANASALIVSVFGDAVLPRGSRIWLGALIQLLEPLGLNERLVRTTVFRLVKDEWLQTQAHGRRTDYMLTEAGRRRFEDASRHIYAADAPPWDRRWRMIVVASELDTPQRERLRRALYWQGFGELRAGCFVHPSADLPAVFDALGADGLGPLLPQLMPLLAVNLPVGPSADAQAMVRAAWDLAGLAEGYQRFVATYTPILDALQAKGAQPLSEQAAFLVRTLLIHDYRRLLLRDPELPEVLLHSEWAGTRARVVCREVYRRVLAASERHLDQQLTLASGDSPRASALVTQRFQATDLLDPPL